jgi:acetyl esterase/lipase
MSDPSWQSHVLSALVRSQMRPEAIARRPIDPVWVRRKVGRPRFARRLMARATGAVARPRAPEGGWPGGEQVAWPEASPEAPVLLYLHGGGYIACSPETHRPLAASLARRVRGMAWVPRYRLAPEHPFPAALDDARAAYRWLLEAQRVDPPRLVLVGDSAGGGLALALALALRDEGWPQPAAIVAFSPWADLTASGASLDENSTRCAMFAGDTIRRAARLYPGAMAPDHPLVSPVFGDYRGIAPLLLHASRDEVLRDDAVRVAARAAAHGTPVTLRLWAGVPHCWQFFAAVLPEARESLEDARAFIARHVAPQVPPHGSRHAAAADSPPRNAPRAARDES